MFERGLKIFEVSASLKCEERSIGLINSRMSVVEPELDVITNDMNQVDRLDAERQAQEVLGNGVSLEWPASSSFQQ